LLNRKFDEMIDQRDELKIQVEKCEEKIDKVLDLLTNHLDSIKETTATTVIKVKPPKPDSVLSQSSVNSMTAVETDCQIKTKKILNERARTERYPKSNVTRIEVADNKVPWSVQWPGYEPVEYTSKLVLNNLNADNNLLA
jgi:hypothetical protein